MDNFISINIGRLAKTRTHLPHPKLDVGERAIDLLGNAQHAATGQELMRGLPEDPPAQPGMSRR
jgi:hypothetical protein